MLIFGWSLAKKDQKRDKTPDFPHKISEKKGCYNSKQKAGEQGRD